MVCLLRTPTVIIIEVTIAPGVMALVIGVLVIGVLVAAGEIVAVIIVAGIMAEIDEADTNSVLIISRS